MVVSPMPESARSWWRWVNPSARRSEVMVSTEQQVTEGRSKRERDYWIRRLSRDLAPSSLMADYRRPSGFSSEKGIVEFELVGSVYQSLIRLTGSSLFLRYAAFMGALKVCLFKYTRNTTVVVGSPALRELHKPNALAIVDEVDGQSTFRQLLMAVRET